MLTREVFDRQRAAASAIERRHGRLVAVVAVTLGLAQLGFIRVLGEPLGGVERAAVVAVFLAYLALVTALLWRLRRRVRTAVPRCPHRGVALAGAAERVAVASGRCDACGVQAVAAAPMPPAGG